MRGRDLKGREEHFDTWERGKTKGSPVRCCRKGRYCVYSEEPRWGNKGTCSVRGRGSEEERRRRKSSVMRKGGKVIQGMTNNTRVNQTTSPHTTPP